MAVSYRKRKTGQIYFLPNKHFISVDCYLLLCARPSGTAIEYALTDAMFDFEDEGIGAG